MVPTKSCDVNTDRDQAMNAPKQEWERVSLNTVKPSPVRGRTSVITGRRPKLVQVSNTLVEVSAGGSGQDADKHWCAPGIYITLRY